jgi:hypothetical protein
VTPEDETLRLSGKSPCCKNPSAPQRNKYVSHTVVKDVCKQVTTPQHNIFTNCLQPVRNARSKSAYFHRICEFRLCMSYCFTHILHRSSCIPYKIAFWNALFLRYWTNQIYTLSSAYLRMLNSRSYTNQLFDLDLNVSLVFSNLWWRMLNFRCSWIHFLIFLGKRQPPGLNCITLIIKQKKNVSLHLYVYVPNCRRYLYSALHCTPQRPSELLFRCTFTNFKLPLVSPNIPCSQRPRQPFRLSIHFQLLRLGPSGYGAALPDAIFMIPCRRFPRHVGAYLIKIFGALYNNTENFGTSALAPLMWKIVHGRSAYSNHPKSFLPLWKRLQTPTKRWQTSTILHGVASRKT